MTYIPFHTAGRPVCAQKKEWGFKNVSNKFKSIKSKKKKKRRWSIGKKKLKMKRKTNYPEKRKNKQTTTTTKKKKQQPHTQNAKNNAYHVCSCA